MRAKYPTVARTPTKVTACPIGSVTPAPTAATTPEPSAPIAKPSAERAAHAVRPMGGDRIGAVICQQGIVLPKARPADNGRIR